MSQRQHNWMLALLAVAIALIFAAVGASAARAIEGRLTGSEAFPELGVLPINTKVVLDGGAQVAYIDEEGSFAFPLVGDGQHLLEVVSPGFFFDKVRLTVTGNIATASFHLDGTHWTAPGPALPMPLALPIRAKLNYFTPRERFSVASIFANPMLLMMGATIVMFVFLPKMMSNIDPEALKEIQERQKEQKKIEMPDISQNLANWFQPAAPGPSSSLSSKKK